MTLTINPTLLHSRWMIRRDMPQVLNIEALSDCTDPWFEEDILKALRDRKCIGVVVESEEIVLAYGLYELTDSKTITLLRLLVDPRYRRKGVATHLLNRLINKLSSHRRTRIRAEVNEEHLQALLFLKGRGFRAVEVVRGGCGRRDAIVMQYRLGE